MTLLAFVGVISSAIYSGTSLLYITLGEIIDQRSGIVNLGLEGVLLISGATGVAVTSLSGNPILGVLAATAAGGLTNLILGFLVVTRRSEPVGEWPGADVLRVWCQRIDRPGLRRPED